MSGVIDEIIGELGLDSLNTYSEGYLVDKSSFADMVRDVLDGKMSVFDVLLKQLENSFVTEILGTKDYFIGVLSFLFITAMFNKMVNSKNSYLNSVSFLMVYGALMVLLMESFAKLETIVITTIDGLIGFMNVLIPVYATTLIVTGNISTGSSYYIFSFGCMYLIEWVTKLVLIPATQIFLFLVFINNMFEEDSLSKLAELLEKIIRFVLKLFTGIVFGMGTVQKIISAAKDQVTNSLALKTIRIIPGVGNAVSATGETILSCGVLVKNCVGVVGIIVMIAIVLSPLIKIAIYTLGYKAVAAVAQPVSDKRIVEGVNGTARASEIYLCILFHMGSIFIITVSIVCMGAGKV